MSRTTELREEEGEDSEEQWDRRRHSKGGGAQGKVVQKKYEVRRGGYSKEIKFPHRR